MHGFSRIENPMDSNTPSQIRSSTLFLSEDSHSCLLISEDSLTKESCRKAYSPALMIIPRVFLIRVGIFAILELGFIAFASTLLSKPILLSISSTVTEAKGAITIITIIWHALAIFMVKDILLIVFSAEWTAQHQLPQSSAHRELDFVSRLTTGYIDQIKHVFSRRATHPFRLGFVSSLFLIMINALGPSAVSVDFAPYQYPLKVKVVNLTLTDYSLNMYATDRAKMIIKLEQVENSTYGFSSTPSNILVPWPARYSIPPNAIIQYQTDVIKYNFSCSWKSPASVTELPNFDSPDTLADIWTLDGESWYLQASSPIPNPMFEPLILPLSLSVLQRSSLFIFTGRNTTLKSDGPALNGALELNLEGIPSLFVPEVFNRGPFLPSFLLCDPQFQVLPATVNATESFLEATILPGNTVVNNIPLEAANIIFSRSLSDAISELVRGEFGPNLVARLLFLSDTRALPPSAPPKPVSVDEIGQRMNKMLLSSSKAYLSGYRPNATDEANPTFEMMDTDALAEVKKMALVGSRPFLIALTVVVGLVIVLLTALLVTLKGRDLQSAPTKRSVSPPYRLIVGHHYLMNWPNMRTLFLKPNFWF